MQQNSFIKIIFIFCLITLFFVENSFYAFGEDSKEPGTSQTGDVLNSFTSSVSTSPECYINTGDIMIYGGEIILGVTGIVVGIKLISSGTALIAVPAIFTQIKGAAMIAAGTASMAAGAATLGKFAVDASGQTLCYLSFVRDPIEYYPNFIPDGHPDKAFEGKIKGFEIDQATNRFKGFKPVNNYWEGMQANNSDKITICSRSPFFTTGIFEFQGCHGKNQAGWITGGPNFKKQPDYNGKNSLLCPEEYRQIARKPIESEFPWEAKKLACTESGGKKCSRETLASEYKGHQDSLKDFKLTFGGPSCQTIEFGTKDEKKSTTIHGYRFTAKAKGSKICSYITHGLGFIPLNKEWNIGCINKKSFNVFPKCFSSIPIYENFKIDPQTGAIQDFGDPQYKIIQYDNSPCLNTYNSCGISELCKNHLGNKIFQAPIPITSYIYGCIKDTSNNLFYGCGTGTNNSGMLSVFQKRLWPIVFLTLIISIVAFAFKILFIDSQIKTSTFTIFLMKIAFVIYLTNQTGSGSNTHNGIEIYYNFLTKASNGLQAIVLKAASQTNGLCNYDDSKYDSKGEKGKYLYLKPWDILDCRLVYYLTTSWWPGNKPFDSNMFEHAGAFLNYGISFIVMILALIFFVIFLFFWVMMITEIIIVTGVLSSLLILLSPIFIPFILFEATKKMFDQWLAKLITFSLYPIMLFAFLGFSFIMVDRIAFGETEFIEAPNEEYIMGRKVKYFEIDQSKDFSSKASCQGISQDLIPKGCDCSGANCILNLVEIKTKETGSFLGRTIGADVKTESSKVTMTLHKNVFSLLLMIFVMYHLTKQINLLLDVLSGSSLTLSEIDSRSPQSRMEGLISSSGVFNWNPTNQKNEEGDDKKKKAARGLPKTGSTSTSSGISGGFDPSDDDKKGMGKSSSKKPSSLSKSAISTLSSESSNEDLISTRQTTEESPQISASLISSEPERFQNLEAPGQILGSDETRNSGEDFRRNSEEDFSLLSMFRPKEENDDDDSSSISSSDSGQYIDARDYFSENNEDDDSSTDYSENKSSRKRSISSDEDPESSSEFGNEPNLIFNSERYFTHDERDAHEDLMKKIKESKKISEEKYYDAKEDFSDDADDDESEDDNNRKKRKKPRKGSVEEDITRL